MQDSVDVTAETTVLVVITTHVTPFAGFSETGTVLEDMNAVKDSVSDDKICIVSLGAFSVLATVVVEDTLLDRDILSMKDIECESDDISVVKILLVEGINNSVGPFSTAIICEACIVVLCVDDASCVEENIWGKEADRGEDTVNEGVELPVARAELEKIGLFSEAIICEPFIVVVGVDNTVCVEETAWVK